MDAREGEFGTRKKASYGWRIVACGLIVEAIQAALLAQAFGFYVIAWVAEFEWTKTSVSAAFAIYRAISGLIAPIQGIFLERYGPRYVMLSGTVIFGTSFLLLSRIDSLAMLYLAFVGVAIGASLSGPMSTTATIVNWIETKRARAIAITQLGMGVGGLLVPVVAIAIATEGWRMTAAVSGLVILVVGIPLSLVMRARTASELEPVAPVLAGDSDGGPVVARWQSPSLTVRQAVRTRPFWFISLGHAFAVTFISAVMVHLVSFLTEDVKLPLEYAALIVTVLTIMTLIGQAFGGLVGDQLDKGLVISGAMMLHASALLLLAFATSPWHAIIFAVMHGFAWGVRGPLTHALRADFFGVKSFARISGVSTLIVMSGMVVGPFIGGVLADQLDSYRLAFVLLAGVAVCGAVLFSFCRRPQRSL